MGKESMALYERLILGHPRLCLVAVSFAVALLALAVPRFQLDASGDSLLLESDQNLEYYRTVRRRYGSDEFLILTYSPKEDLFSTEVLDDLQTLRDEIADLDQVASVVSMLDVPLLESQSATAGESGSSVTRLLDERTDIEVARNELMNA